MSSVLNKTALDEVGGLEKFSGYIAEDYFIGKPEKQLLFPI